LSITSFKVSAMILHHLIGMQNIGTNLIAP
jgi:hypothetical protein